MQHTRPRPLRFRIAATTDLHAHVLGHDYLTGHPMQRHSLASLVPVIDGLRADDNPLFLMDNGDFLFGAPFGETLGEDADQSPVIGAMNRLGYDAAVLGNHDFDKGLEPLGQILSQAAFPVLADNVEAPDGGPATQRDLILERQIDGQNLRLGVIGVTPPQVMEWNRHLLDGLMTVHPMVDAARASVARLRAQGADVVIVLAHSGLALTPESTENVVEDLAGIDGIDLIIGGHTHSPFCDVVDGTPVVMPKPFGQEIGVANVLVSDDGVAVEAKRVPAAETTDAAFSAGFETEHQATLARMALPIGQMPRRMHNYFTTIRPSDDLALVAEAGRQFVQTHLRGTGFAALPLLSIAAPFRSGGFDGRGAFVDIPAGPLERRHVTELYPFPNEVAAVVVRGETVMEWLEMGAGVFNRHKGDGTPLLNPHQPLHDFDTIYGVTYDFDLSQPARYDLTGNIPDPEVRRIRNLAIEGRPVRADEQLVVVANSYRVGGGGKIPGLAEAPRLELPPVSMSEVLACHMADLPADWSPDPPPWGFVPVGFEAVLRTNKTAQEVWSDAPEGLSVTQDEGDTLLCRFRI